MRTKIAFIKNKAKKKATKKTPPKKPQTYCELHEQNRKQTNRCHEGDKVHV